MSHNFRCSSAISLRSTCGSVRRWPVPSSHLTLGAAPQVGQRTSSTLSWCDGFFIHGIICSLLAKKKPAPDPEMADSVESEEAAQAPVLDQARVVSDRAVARDSATHPVRLQMLAIRPLFFSRRASQFSYSPGRHNPIILPRQLARPPDPSPIPRIYAFSPFSLKLPAINRQAYSLRAKSPAQVFGTRRGGRFRCQSLALSRSYSPRDPRSNPCSRT